jgi:GTP-binding protein Era
MKNASQSAGLIAIIGAPNAGKSTLTNALVGQKVSIVTPKVQTTRFCVRGVFCDGAAQVVLVDTPGIFEAKQNFERSLVKEAFDGLKGVDATVLLVDVSKRITDEVHGLLAKMLTPASKQKIALALNKIDALKKHELLEITTDLAAKYTLPEVFMISAKTGDGLVELKRWMVAALPEHPWFYPEDQVSDLPMRVLVSEIIREKLFMLMREELPYNLTVVGEAWEETDRAAVIKQAIIVTRENHKKMVIGKGGETVKRVGESVRKELESMLEKKVHLTLFVKVDANWQNKVIAQGLNYEG